MSLDILATVPIEEMSASQLRRALRAVANDRLPHHKKKDEDKEKDKDDAADDNDSLVDLDREKGDSKPPQVNKDDLPTSAKKDDEEEDEDEDEDKGDD